MRLVYIDESGDHSLKPSNTEYPVFVMVACVFDSMQYANNFVPAMTCLKLRHWGHDGVVLHEREIRRPSGDFSFLLRPDRRGKFLSDIERLVADSKSALHGVIWDKRLTPMGESFEDIYSRCLGALISQVSLTGVHEETNWIIESRGRKEDREALAGLSNHIEINAINPTFVPKAYNVPGLQLADLCARPIGAIYLNPDQPSRAFSTIAPLLSPPANGRTGLSGLVRLF